MNLLGSYLRFPEKKLQVAPTENAVIFHVTGNVLCAGAVNSGMHFHVRVNDIQVDLLILERGQEGAGSALVKQPACQVGTSGESDRAQRQERSTLGS